MSEIIEKHKYFLVKSEYGTYTFNNRKTAEQLYNTLTQYEKDYQTYQGINKQYDNITKQIIQLKLTINILSEEINQLQNMVTK